MRSLSLVVALIVAAIACQPASAQRSAASKITGSAYEYPYFYQSAGAYQQSAYQHADLLREATSYGEPIPQDIAQEHATAIRQNVDAASKKYDSLRKMAGEHAQVKKHLDAIDAHHKAVLEQADKIKQGGDAETVGAASHAAAESLKSAQAEHEKLMQYFSRPPAKK